MSVTGLLLAILPPNTIDVKTTVVQMMAPYYLDLVVQPYKQYIPSAVWFAKTLWHMDTEQAVYEHMRRIWPYKQMGIDEGGIWWMTQENPNYKWSSWSFGMGYRIMEQDEYLKCRDIRYITQESEGKNPIQCNLFPMKNIPISLNPDAILTPDGKWHDYKEYDNKENWNAATQNWFQIYSEHQAATIKFYLFIEGPL